MDSFGVADKGIRIGDIPVERPTPFMEYLVEVGARALCALHERRDPDSLQPVVPADFDMRKKLRYGDPLWMKYKRDAQYVIAAIFASNRTKR